MLTKEHQVVIIAYLAEKLGVDEDWFVVENQQFFGCSPADMVAAGNGERVIAFLEERLGLRAGAAF